MFFHLFNVTTETLDKKLNMSNHGTIIWTGITCKKIPCYMCDSACRWLVVENAKKFQKLC